MKVIFQIFRFPLFPVPVVVWTILWPILVLASFIIIPIWLFVTAILRCLGFPFVFLYSAINEETDNLNQYLRNWKKSNKEIISGLQVPIASQYKTIFGWLESPKKNGGAGAVVLYNTLGIVVAGSIYSETILIAVILIIVGIVALLIWID